MSRKLSCVLAVALALVVVVGCGPQVRDVPPPHMAPRLDPVPSSGSSTGPSAEPSLGSSSVPASDGIVSRVRWSLPADGKFIGFLGTKILATKSDKQILDALDESGKVVWSRQLGGEIHGVVLRSDLSEALVRTSTGYHWVDLNSGQVLGEPPISEPVIGDILWHGEWFLIGLPVNKGPVDPQAPGQSFSHTEWTLYQSQREQRVWIRVGVLVDQGGNLASMSLDGKRTLIRSQSTGEYVLFEGGKRLTGLKPGTDESLIMLTSSGNYAVKRYPNGAVFYGTDEQIVAELTAPGNQLTLWGERAVLTNGDTFAVFDHFGTELFRQRGSVPRHQSNPSYLLVTGSKSRLLDPTGRPIIQFGTQTPQMTPDGCWVYERDERGFAAYALSGCD